MNEARKTLEYVVASLYKIMAYIRLLNSIKELQKYQDVKKTCLQGVTLSTDGEFHVKDLCDNFDTTKCCSDERCPLRGLNKNYFDAMRNHKDAMARLKRAKEQLFAAKVK